jgi:nucleoid-associated protein YgaU
MPKRITRATVILNRGGSRITPPIGRLFDYTDKELAQINKLHPDAVEKPKAQEAEYIAPSTAGNVTAAAADKAAADKAAADKAAADKAAADKAAADKAAADKAAADKAAADKSGKNNKDQDL